MEYDSHRWERGRPPRRGGWGRNEDDGFFEQGDRRGNDARYFQHFHPHPEHGSHDSIMRNADPSFWRDDRPSFDQHFNVPGGHRTINSGPGSDFGRHRPPQPEYIGPRRPEYIGLSSANATPIGGSHARFRPSEIRHSGSQNLGRHHPAPDPRAPTFSRSPVTPTHSSTPGRGSVPGRGAIPGRGSTIMFTDADNNEQGPPMRPAERKRRSDIARLKKIGRIKCANCKKPGHGVDQCIHPKEDGYVHGCPACNGTHDFDDCLTCNHERDYIYLVKMRARRPRIWSTKDLQALWELAGRPDGDLPWTEKFTKDIMSGESPVPGFDLETFEYSQDPASDIARLPLDPASKFDTAPVNDAKRRHSESPAAASPEKRARTTDPSPRAQEQSMMATATHPGPAFLGSGLPVLEPRSEDGKTMSGLPAIKPEPESPRSQLYLGDQVEFAQHIINSPVPQGTRHALEQLEEQPPPSIGVIPTMTILGNTTATAEELSAIIPNDAIASPPIKPSFDDAVPAGSCPNCWVRLSQCQCKDVQNLCRACGSRDHTIETCKDGDNVCFCTPIPGHTVNQCPAICRGCWITADRTNEDTLRRSLVLAVDCQKHCARCALPKHDDMHCEIDCFHDTCWVCKSTGAGAVHFSQDCREMICVAEKCEVHAIKRCAGHCFQCGAFLVPGMISRHRCQWAKHMVYFELGETFRHPVTQQKLYINRWALKCIRHPQEHPSVFAVDLEQVRKAGYERLKREIEEWWSLGCPGGEAANPLFTRPVIECPQCFELSYEGGDYLTQTPGRLL